MMQVELDTVLRMLQTGYTYLLLAGADERIEETSPALAERFAQLQWFSEFPLDEGSSLGELLQNSTVEQIHAISQSPSAEMGRRIDLMLRDVENTVLPTTLFLIGEGEKRKLVFVGATKQLHDWETEERIKELKCLYAVAEWVEDSKSEEEFFTELPKYLAPGLLMPDEVKVWAEYRGVQYGVRPRSKHCVWQKVLVHGEIQGEIGFGYDEETVPLLEEERRLLVEVARMTRVAIERKRIGQLFAEKKEEAEDYRRELNEVESRIRRQEQRLRERESRLQTLSEAVTASERGLSEKKEILQALFQESPDEMALIDNNYNVLFTNSHGGDNGAKCYQIFFERSTPCEQCRLRAVNEKKAPLITEIRHLDAIYQVQAIPVFDAEREVTGIIEHYQDVTEKKAIEQQLEQTSKLTALGELVSGIGHEINNPNQFIQGNIRIIRQFMEEALPELDKTYAEQPGAKIANLPYEFLRKQIPVLLDDMERGSQRIKNIVAGLKRFARKDEGLLVDTVDLNNVIYESLPLIENQVRKTANVHLECQEDLPSITGNSQKIEQVIVNLIVNASQAMPKNEKGDVWVRTFGEEEYAVVQVEDNGSGMDEHTLKHLFDPFFTTKRARGGTGIGLSISLRFVEEHKGTLSVESELGRGSTFTVRIPYQTEAEEN